MSGVLLVIPAGPKAAPAEIVPAAAAWPNAKRGAAAAVLADGSAYEPGIFVDASTSVGTARSADGRFLRLVVLGPSGTTRQLRSVAVTENRSFAAFTVAGGTVAWIEGDGRGPSQIWAAELSSGKARELTADGGRAGTFHSQYDLVIADGRVHWVAAGAGDVTEVRSVALTGGAVDVRTESGSWQLSAWPWLVNGVAAAGGTTLLRNLADHRDVAIQAGGARATTNCSPVWCRVVSISDDGFNRIDLAHPDGGARMRIAGGTAETIIDDVAPLDRFEVLSVIDPSSELTGNARLLIFEIATRRTVEASPDAGKVAYRNGVLSWATGSLQSFVWHSLDLRTI